MSTRLLIIEDHVLFAEVIADLLREKGIVIVGVANTGRDGLSKARREEPDAVILDLGLDDLDGFTVGRAILADRPSTKVVALTARRDRRAVAEAASAGFHGYVTKDVPLPRFVTELRRVLDGQTSSPAMPRRQPQRLGDVRFALRQLSPRERDVIEMLREGLGTASIANALGVTRNTVRSHVQRILTKLQVHSRLEAVALVDGVHSAGTVKPPEAAGHG